MKRSCNVAGACLLGAILAACSSHIGYTPTPMTAPNATPTPPPSAYTLLYSFKSGRDGANPEAALVESRGKLYGTTYDGGGVGCTSTTGCGTVFEISPSGQERVVYRFKGNADGAHPKSSLVFFNDSLFGTTQSGGGTACGSGCGTVFALSASGHERVVYRFQGGSDGVNPEAGLLLANGELFGTTENGGDAACLSGCGTVFRVTPSSGAEKVIYRFKGGNDGFHPVAAVIAANGEFYGTTQSGGIVSSSPPSYACVYYTPGCGTVFAVNSHGKERVVLRFFWSFADPLGGATPMAPLFYANGAFFGTTILGGTNGNATMFGPGCGTAFRLLPGGRLNYIHIFHPPNSYYCNAAYPNGLIWQNGWVYGTTQDIATIFKIGPSGAYKTLYTFKGGTDGALPLAAMIVGPKAVLYGTTAEGGGSGCYKATGCGTVFALKP